MSKKNPREMGYNEDGPTDRQIEFQDAVDNLIFQFLNDFHALYVESDGKTIATEIEWDIGKITAIREEAQDQLDLEDIY